MSRMNRQSWVTTKKIDRLQGHLDLYIGFNNKYIKYLKPKREYSKKELKRICAVRYKYVEIDYAKRLRKYKIRSFRAFHSFIAHYKPVTV